MRFALATPAGWSAEMRYAARVGLVSSCNGSKLQSRGKDCTVRASDISTAPESLLPAPATLSAHRRSSRQVAADRAALSQKQRGH